MSGQHGELIAATGLPLRGATVDLEPVISGHMGATPELKAAAHDQRSQRLKA